MGLHLRFRHYMNEKRNKYCLLDTPPQSTVKQSIILSKIISFSIKLLHAYVQHVCDKYAKYHVVSTNTVMHALSPYIQKIQLSRTAEKWLSSMKFYHCLLKMLWMQNPYLKANRKNWLSSQSCHLSIINILAPNFFMQMFNVSILLVGCVEA